MSTKSFNQSNFRLLQHISALFLIYLFCALPQMICQSEINTFPIGKWREGNCTAAIQKDNLIFYSNGCILEIAELNEDNIPVALSAFESKGRIFDLLIDGNYAYLTIEDEGLSIVSLADIMHPVETGFCEYKQYYPRIQYKDQRIYSMSRSTKQVKVIDVSDPNVPFILHALSVEYTSNAVIHDHYIFAACQSEGFKIFDISDPGSWVEVYHQKGGYFKEVDVLNDKACILESDTLRILDISDPMNPMEISKLKLYNYAEKAKMNDNFVFAAGHNLETIDISNPNVPVIADTKSLPLNANYLNVSESMISISIDNGILRYEADANGILDPKGEIPVPGLTTSLAIRDHYAYASQFSNGITILDVMDPAMPVPLKFMPVDNEINSLQVRDQYLFVSNRGLSTFDITDPLNPELLSYLALNQPSYKMYILEDVLFMAAGANGLAIIDISDPGQPGLISTLDTPGSALDMDIHHDEKIIYLADLSGGLRMIDISVLSAPVEVGSITINAFKPLYSVKVKDGFAWIGSSNFGIRIYDISNLSNPAYIKDLNTSRGYDIHIKNQFAVVAAGYVGLYIYEISQFNAPKFIALYNTPGDIKTVTLARELLYCSDYYCGVSIFEFDQCSLLKLNAQTFENKCFSDCEGSIVINNVDYALLPLQYNWSGGQNDSAVSGLCAGTYFVTITDDNNCVITESFTIAQPPILAFDQIFITDITAGSAGAISVHVIGGTPPYEYYWEGPGGFGSSSQNISGLDAGCYTLTIKDSNECTLISEELCIQDLTAVKNMGDDHKVIMLFPNPATNKIILNSIGIDDEYLDISNIKIFSTDGSMIKQFNDLKVPEFDIEDLNSGIYLVLVVKTNGEVFSQCLVKQ